MPAFRENVLPLTISLIGHVALVLLLLFGLRSAGGAAPIATNIIEGVVVGDFELPAEPVEMPPEVQPTPDEEEIVPPPPDPEDVARATEEQRLAEEARVAEEQRFAEEARLAEERRKEAERLAEEQRKAEEARLAEERRQEAVRLAEERRKKAERLAEEQRKAEERRQEEARLAEERRKAEEARLAEERRKAEEARLAEERERERKAAAERARAAQEARRKAEAEEALRAQLAEEEARYSAVDAGLQYAYITKIKQAIQRKWSPPAFTGKPKCVVLVRQLRSGDVASIESVDCGGNEPLERSLRAAVEKASPLPQPDEESLFDPNLRIVFEPEDD